MERDKADPLIRPGDILSAAALLTRLPLPRMAPGAYRGGAAAWAWPLVGLGVGGVSAGVLALATLVLPMGIAAALALATGVILTGALHFDGLADSADGLWGGQDKDRRLEIMSDSRIGSYGVMALVLAALLMWSAMAATGPLALIAAAALSRAAMAGVMTLVPAAKSAGLSQATGAPGPATSALACAIAILAALLLCGASAVLASCAVLAVAGAWAAIAKAKIGGQTGDILGATQILTEIAALVSFAALL